MLYFKHMTNMRNDIKIKRLISKYGLEGYGLYNLILETIAEGITTEHPLPELQETCEDIATFYNGNTARINEIAAFMVNQGLFELDEVTGRMLCNKIYKFLEQSQTRSEEIKTLINNYKNLIPVSDSLRPSLTVTENHSEEQEQNKNKNRTEQNNNSEFTASFEKFWNIYSKKIERGKCEKLWKKVDPAFYEQIFFHAEEYVKNTPDKKFRKNPETYLYNKCWNDEIIPHDKKTPRASYSSTLERLEQEYGK